MKDGSDTALCLPIGVRSCAYVSGGSEARRIYPRRYATSSNRTMPVLSRKLAIPSVLHNIEERSLGRNSLAIPWTASRHENATFTWHRSFVSGLGYELRTAHEHLRVLTITSGKLILDLMLATSSSLMTWSGFRAESGVAARVPCSVKGHQSRIAHPHTRPSTNEMLVCAIYPSA